MMDPEAIKQAMQNINFNKLYENLRQAVINFGDDHTVENELKMLEAEKIYWISAERYYGYEKILNGEDASEVKDNIDKLETEFNNIKERMLE